VRYTNRSGPPSREKGMVNPLKMAQEVAARLRHIVDSGRPVTDIMADLHDVPARDLKRELKVLGLDVTACLDRDSLIELLEHSAGPLIKNRASHREQENARKNLAWEREQNRNEKDVVACAGSERNFEIRWRDIVETPPEVAKRMEEKWPDPRLRRKAVDMTNNKSMKTGLNSYNK